MAISPEIVDFGGVDVPLKGRHDLQPHHSPIMAVLSTEMRVVVARNVHWRWFPSSEPNSRRIHWPAWSMLLGD